MPRKKITAEPTAAEQVQTPTAAEQSPDRLAELQQRVAELEALARKPHDCAVLKLQPALRLYTGRVTLPNYGVPLPAGVGFHGYVNVRLEDDQIGGEVVPPSEEEVVTLLRIEAQIKFPGYVDVTLADVSVLPEGW